MWAVGHLADDSERYLRMSALLLAPFALLAAGLLARMTGYRALLWALAPALILYSFHNWDLLVVAAAVTGFYLWSRGHPVAAGVAFGVGAGFKMWPIFFLAPLFFEGLARRDLKRALLAPVAGVATVVAVNLPFALANFDGWWATYAFHSERGPNYDSIWYFGRPEWGAHEINLWSAVLTGGFFLAILALGWIRARRDDEYPFLQVCAALMATFLLWNKVHSPQFTLWILPFFALLRVNLLWWAAYAVADLAVYVGIFRWFHDLGQEIDMGPAKQLLIGGIWARAALLLILVGVFLLARRAAPPGPEQEPPLTPETPPKEPSQVPATV
jgi:uncharacterized membrane protein